MSKMNSWSGMFEPDLEDEEVSKLVRERMTDEERAYFDARRRVRELREFYSHAAAYAVFNALMLVINLVTSPNKLWFFWPLFGWGIGLTIHGMYVYGFKMWLGKEWEDRKIQQLLAQKNFTRVSSEKKYLEAHLRLLQAQIEPHFLFNTLANVVSLVDKDGARAKQMLEDFIQYLRTSLSATRGTRSTLGKQFELLRTYLNIIAIRMDKRLKFTLDVPAELQGLSLPPMLLQPIVENAIKHGLEPKLDGGKVEISAATEDKKLLLKVVDTGLGFRSSSAPSGVGLTNLRERLSAYYDGQASLQIEDNLPSGTIVTITIPMELVR